jgi:hypothetical protein
VVMLTPETVFIAADYNGFKRTSKDMFNWFYLEFQYILHVYSLPDMESVNTQEELQKIY